MVALAAPVNEVGTGGMEEQGRRPAATFARNASMSVGRLVISTAVGFVLPSFLIHRLPVSTYSAWVLILQMSAYVNYLDFGIQTGISKYVAEFQARKDAEGSGSRASAGLALLLGVSALGALLTVGVAWRVPQLFHEMPPALYTDVRLGLLFVGLSTSFALLCSIFAAIFMGLQRFGVPTVLALINRVGFVVVVLSAVLLHQSLAMMGALVAVVNVATGLAQFVAWRRLASHVRLSLKGLDPGMVRMMVRYCSSLAVWTVGMLCVSGLDVTIVGRYDYAQTGFYSIAVTPTNFMLAILGSALAPLMPTASALSVHRSPAQMGNLLAKMTRYSSTLLIASALPLLVGGYWILRLWVGAGYGMQIVGYMRILVLANVLRNLCAPYASMLVATNIQNVAIAGASAEAIVNLVSSVYLAKRMGAIGVAYGTLLGSFVSVGMHFAWSMRYSFGKVALSRRTLLWEGALRPALMVLPSLILLPLWWTAGPPAMNAGVWSLWALSTALLAWFASLQRQERMGLTGAMMGRIRAVLH